jgi:hypothetical protein
MAIGKFTTASVTAKDIDYESGNKFAKIHGETVLLVGIKSGPNKGNFAGFTLGEDTRSKDFYDFVQGKNRQEIDAQLSYMIGAERVPSTALAGDLGPVATASGIKALSSKYELSSSLSGLTGVDQSNAVGQGYYSETTGEWVSTFSTNAALKEIGVNWLSNVVDPSNYGPSRFLIKGKGSFSGWNKFQSDFKGTYVGGNRSKASSGDMRSNPASQAPLDVPIPDPT